jgi:hypothetical protein
MLIERAMAAAVEDDVVVVDMAVGCHVSLGGSAVFIRNAQWREPGLVRAVG